MSKGGNPRGGLPGGSRQSRKATGRKNSICNDFRRCKLNIERRKAKLRQLELYQHYLRNRKPLRQLTLEEMQRFNRLPLKQKTKYTVVGVLATLLTTRMLKRLVKATLKELV